MIVITVVLHANFNQKKRKRIKNDTLQIVYKTAYIQLSTHILSNLTCNVYNKLYRARNQRNRIVVLVSGIYYVYLMCMLFLFRF